MSIKPDPQFQLDVQKAVEVGTTPFTNGGKTVVLFPVGPASNQLQVPDIENAIGSAGSRERANGIDPTVCGMLWHGRMATISERPHAKFDRLDQPGMDTAILLDDVAKACATGSGGGGVIVPVTERLDVRGPLFVAGGQPFKMKSVSMFTLAQRFERGEDITPQINWVREMGGNCVDVFAQFCFMNWPNPKRDPFIAKVETLIGLTDDLMNAGLRVNWRILADCQEFGDDNGTPIHALNMPHAQQVARVREVIVALRPFPNVTLCIANEPPFNGVDVWRIVDDLDLGEKANRPFLMDSGDYTIIGNESGFRVLDIFGDHPDRDAEYPAEAAKTGHFVYDGWGPDAHSPGFAGFRHFNGGNVAVYTAEPMKYGEVPFDGEDTADTSLMNAEQAGGGWGVGASGACFHSVDGIRSRVPGPNQTACARAFFAAMDFSPADSFAGEYSHDTFPTWPLENAPAGTAVEVAGRVLPNGDVYGVCALPNNWNPVAKPGRAILERKGQGGTLLKMR